jgi:Trk K+ transport system NAD-binding subunit
VGLPLWGAAGAPGGGGGEHGDAQRDLFLLGVSREGVALLQHLQRESSALKERIVAIDFNPETLERVRAEGVEGHYGDLANAESLRHAGLATAGLIVSGISDWFLKGTDNRRLLRHAKALAPAALVVVTADTIPHAQTLYAEGADYVLIPPVLAAEHLYGLLLDPSPVALAEARQRQAAQLFETPPG